MNWNIYVKMTQLQFVLNIFSAWFSVILKMMDNSEWFDIQATCYLITAGPYAKRIIKIATLVAKKLAKMSRRVKCTGLLC